MTSPFVEVRNLHLTSGSRVLQRDLCFEAPRGRVLAIVGEEGSGKRALLRTMIGIEAPAGGDVFYDGEPLWAVPRGFYLRARFTAALLHDPETLAGM